MSRFACQELDTLPSIHTRILGNAASAIPSLHSWLCKCHKIALLQSYPLVSWLIFLLGFISPCWDIDVFLIPKRYLHFPLLGFKMLWIVRSELWDACWNGGWKIAKSSWRQIQNWTSEVSICVQLIECLQNQMQIFFPCFFKMWDLLSELTQSLSVHSAAFYSGSCGNPKSCPALSGCQTSAGKFQGEQQQSLPSNWFLTLPVSCEWGSRAQFRQEGQVKLSIMVLGFLKFYRLYLHSGCLHSMSKDFFLFLPTRHVVQFFSMWFFSLLFCLSHMPKDVLKKKKRKERQEDGEQSPLRVAIILLQLGGPELGLTLLYIGFLRTCFFAVKWEWVILDMVYVLKKELATAVLLYVICSHGLFSSSWPCMTACWPKSGKLLSRFKGEKLPHWELQPPTMAPLTSVLLSSSANVAQNQTPCVLRLSITGRFAAKNIGLDIKYM